MCSSCVFSLLCTLNTLPPSLPLSLDKSPVLFRLHVQFKLCTPLLQNWKCLLLILDGPLFLLLILQPLQSLGFSFSFSFCLLSPHLIVKLYLCGCHTGDMNTCVHAAFRFQQQRVWESAPQERDSFNSQNRQQLWTFMSKQMVVAKREYYHTRHLIHTSTEFNRWVKMSV